jgi:hypothetical protein
MRALSRSVFSNGIARAQRRRLAPIVLVCVGAVAAMAGTPNAISSSPKKQQPRLFVAGTLANYDNRPLRSARADADVLAVGGGSGIARIEVAVDGKREASRRFRCRPSCHPSGRLRFTYDRARFGPGRHEVSITASDAAGRSARQKIDVEPAPAVGSRGAPRSQPAFYITAGNATDLQHQAADDAARFARTEGPGHSLLVLDFGAARRMGKSYGASLRGGTFFTNQQIRSALAAAALEYHKRYRRGSATIVYASSNAHLAHPGSGLTPFTAATARAAGRQQQLTVRHVHLYSHESAAPGGDIEPGYDLISPPQVAISLVAGASAANGPYFDVGTAPCNGNNCTHGWVVRDICQVTTGSGRQAVPEIYYGHPIDQSGQWSEVASRCGIKSFPGVSSSPLGDYTPAQSWQLLRSASGRSVGNALLVFPR